jgi:hypothetical protein
MEHGSAQAAGSIGNLGLVFWLLAAWLAVVLIYGLRRSFGDAPQDPIRPSGPTE